MKPVTLYKPATVKEATQILVYHGPEAAVHAGGTDLLVRLKNRLNASPKYLVDIRQIEELNFIRETPEGGSPSEPSPPSRRSSNPTWWRANICCCSRP